MKSRLEIFEEYQSNLGYWYYFIEKYGQLQRNECKTSALIKTGKTPLGEMLAAHGIGDIEVDILKEARQCIDNYLETGDFDRAKAVDIVNRLPTDQFRNIVEEYKEAGQAGRDYEGVPQILFVYEYANNLLNVLNHLDEHCKQFGVEGYSKKQKLGTVHTSIAYWRSVIDAQKPSSEENGFEPG